VVLAQIVKMNDHDNIYHDWALTHTEPHYAGEANGVKLYREFKTNFDAQVKEIVPSKFAGLLQDMA
jgi:hypothetical protein